MTSMSALRDPCISPISTIHWPCSFSAAVLSLVSASDRLSLNQSPPSFRRIVDLPMPGFPTRTSTVSNLQPGSSTLCTAPASVFLVTARVYGVSSAPR